MELITLIETHLCLVNDQIIVYFPVTPYAVLKCKFCYVIERQIMHIAPLGDCSVRLRVRETPFC